MNRLLALVRLLSFPLVLVGLVMMFAGGTLELHAVQGFSGESYEDNRQRAELMKRIGGCVALTGPILGWCFRKRQRLNRIEEKSSDSTVWK
ncbi:MAG TPA: hypothetical protein VN688_29415 [Gemmataceae bacterium]|nr:hypothetical protein [Gemmataceae bacterium]